ncbi:MULTISPECIES: alpha/beta fold hydrolase [unclassified Knoellia]|uniref:alpha/beta fold hydrolase n=1 Tax=Knoellia altitudinis TaxID=3404795 RepID=UPI0036066EEE
MQISRFRHAGMTVTDHEVRVALAHDEPDGATISVFAREVVAAERTGLDQPWLLFLQGGPGGKGPRPASPASWLTRALKDHRVLLLDQRGTGRSAPITRQTLPRVGWPELQAEHLAHFRADSIVADAEVLRRELVGEESAWHVLGQSYGGFCALTYLSQAPEFLASVAITGGLPPLTAPAEEVYRISYDRVAEKNARFFDTFPQDRDRVTAVVQHLRTHDVRLPTGEQLSPERFLTIGVELGATSGFDPLHYLLDEAFVPGSDTPVLSETFLAGVHAVVSYATRPLFPVMHEPSYGQGEATRWAADRVRRERPDFDPQLDEPLLTGEMTYPFQLRQDPALADLADAADLLAERTDWPALYDLEALAANDVPVAAAIYHDDMYVVREHSLETARRVRGLRTWVTNEFEHDGLRQSADVLDRLLAMNAGRL